jgi:hypothetical protein
VAVVTPPQEDEDFDESDPIIYIPSLSPREELPPPPPRTEEEAERHAERLEMRRIHDVKKRSSKDVVKQSHHEHKTHEPKLEKKREANTANMPSANAMALLEAHVDDNATETSSISTASAKMYPLEPHEIPELTGVITSRDPPRTIHPTRSRSVHRRSSHKDVAKKSGVDPEEECLELAVVDPPPAVKRSRRKTTTTEATKGRSKSRDRRKDKDHTTATTTVVEPTKSSSKSVHTTHRHHVPSSSVPHSEIKVLSASSARMSRCKQRESSSKSVGHHTSATRSSRQGRSASRSRTTAHRSRSRPKKSASGTRTACTQPLSVSSDEMKATTTAANNEVLSHKNRTRRRKSNASKSMKSMPVAHIAMSSDEKSHASSISSSSTIEESFTYSDDEDCNAAGGKSRKSSIPHKKVAMIKDGAVGLASRGRSTLIGLRGTSRKWQSALFM